MSKDSHPSDFFYPLYLAGVFCTAGLLIGVGVAAVSGLCVAVLGLALGLLMALVNGRAAEHRALAVIRTLQTAAYLRTAAPVQDTPDGVERCGLCKCANPVWYTLPALWKRCTGTHSEEPKGVLGILCPNCFIRVAEGDGICPTAWVLRPETEADLPHEPGLWPNWFRPAFDAPCENVDRHGGTPPAVKADAAVRAELAAEAARLPARVLRGDHEAFVHDMRRAGIVLDDPEADLHP